MRRKEHLLFIFQKSGCHYFCSHSNDEPKNPKERCANICIHIKSELLICRKGNLEQDSKRSAFTYQKTNIEAPPKKEKKEKKNQYQTSFQSNQVSIKSWN